MRNWRGYLDLLSAAGALAVLFGLAIFFGDPSPGKKRAGESVRLAYFPNLTHAPALVGAARGEFQQALPQDVAVDPKLFNAGPEAMEALLAGEVDVAYVGPSPAINTFLKSNGRALRLLAGVCSGGSALVARSDSPVRSIRDLDGRRVAIPQLGGTQDVSLRHFMGLSGLHPREKGGTVEVLPVKNPDILALFKSRQLDAAWVPEPWASRLLEEGGARLVIDERDLWPGGRYSSTVIVARTAYLHEHPDRVEALLRAHLKSIAWLQEHPTEAKETVNAELKRLTTKPLARAVLDAAWNRVEFTADPLPDSIETFVRAATAAGYLPPTGLRMAELLDPLPLERARRSLVAVSSPSRDSTEAEPRPSGSAPAASGPESPRSPKSAPSAKSADSSPSPFSALSRVSRANPGSVAAAGGR